MWVDVADKQWVCPHCDKRYTSKLTLQTHIDGAHGAGCKCVCGETFSWRWQRADHRRSCSEWKIKTEDGKVKLRVKRKSKSADENFVCMHCNKKYTSRLGLRQHINGVHGTGCTCTCGENFKWRWQMMLHRRRCAEWALGKPN